MTTNYTYGYAKKDTVETPTVGPIYDSYGVPDWTLYNRSIVGNHPTGQSTETPGIVRTYMGAYRPVTFGATREYAENEGWTVVTRKKRRNKSYRGE